MKIESHFESIIKHCHDIPIETQALTGGAYSLVAPAAVWISVLHVIRTHRARVAFGCLVVGSDSFAIGGNSFLPVF